MEDDASALEEQIAAEVSASERTTRSSKARADKKEMSGAADAPKGRGASTKTPEAAEEPLRGTNSSQTKQAAATEDDGAQAKDEGRKARRGSSKGRDKSANALELEEDASSGGGKAGESRDTRSRGVRKEADEEEQPVVNADDGDFGGDGGFEVEAEIKGGGGGGMLDAAAGESRSPRQHVEAVELVDEGADTNDGEGEEHEEVGERPEDEEDDECPDDEVVEVDGRRVDGRDEDDVTEERLEGASDGAPAPPPPAKAAPTPPRPAPRRKKKDAGGVQLFAFRSPESGAETAAGPSTSGGAASDRRPKRKLKSIARYSDSNPHAKPPSNGEGYKHGEGFLCPRCGHVCSYDARVCEECHLECCYEAGVGVVTLRERRANEPAKARGDPGANQAGRKEVDRSDGRGTENGAKRGVKRGSLKGRPSKTDGKTGENKAPMEDADVKDEETDTESSSSKDASGEHRPVGVGDEETESAGEKTPARKKSRARGGETTAKQSAPRARPRRSAAVKAAAKLSGDMSDEDSGSEGDSFALDEASLAGSADEYLEEEEYGSGSSGSSGKRPPKSNQRRGGNRGAPLKATKRQINEQNKWDTRSEQLRAYKEVHGDCNVPRKYAQNPQLGEWVITQRRMHKDEKLSVDRTKQLEKIGFEWIRLENDFDKHWNERLEQLQAYNDEHGDCNVPQNYAQNPQLGMWVINQRRRKGKLSDQRRELLEEIGFQWTVGYSRPNNGNRKDGQWNERFEQLQAYNAVHGDCNVPRNYARNPQLGAWVSKQRHRLKNGKLSDQRKRRLEEIRFRF